MLLSSSRLAIATLLAAAVCAGALAQADVIHDIRTDSTTYPDGASISEVTGVVVQDLAHMDYHMGRIHIQDANGGLYSGIVVVDEGGSTGELAQAMELGDVVTLYNVTFADRGAFGNDTLYYTPGTSSFSSTSSAPLPDFTVVSAADLWGGPQAGVGEAYQSMRVMVEDVTIAEMNIGRKDDNYALSDANGDTFLAADYTNEDKQYDFIWWDTLYHHYSCPDTPTATAWEPYFNPISDDGYGGVGQHFDNISGILEASTDSPDWDYYQLLTWDDDSFGITPVPEPSTAVLLLSAAALVALGWRRRSIGVSG